MWIFVKPRGYRQRVPPPTANPTASIVTMGAAASALSGHKHVTKWGCAEVAKELALHPGMEKYSEVVQAKGLTGAAVRNRR